MAPLAPALSEILAERRGAFTRREALAAGYSAGQIRAELARSWEVLRARAYAERELMKDPALKHLLRAEGLALGVKDPLALSHQTAVRWHLIEHLNFRDERVHATRHRPSSEHGRTKTAWMSEGFDVHVAGLPDEHVEIHAGVRVTSAARTVADIARSMSFRDALVIGNSALALGKTTRAEIEAVLVTMRRWPGVKRARKVVDCLDARAANPLESIALALWHESGLPRPELQVWVFDEDGFVGIVDGMWLQNLLAYELDGMEKYRRGGNVLIAEKLRQERAEETGLVLPRFTWRNIWEEGRRSLERVAKACRRVRSNGRPRVRIYLSSRDRPAPTPNVTALHDPEVFGLRLVYDGLKGGIT